MSATFIGLATRHIGLAMAIIGLLLASCMPLCAVQVTLDLKPANLYMQGHRIFIRTDDQAAYDYGQWVYQGRLNTITIDNLQLNTIYHFVARAYSGMFESIDSNEVTFVIPDADNDGISNAQEIDIYGTDPHNPDTDGDGMTDGQALVFWGDLWRADGDQDGVINLLDSDASYADAQQLAGDTPFAVPDPAPSKLGKSYLWLEAEDGDVYYPMQIENGDALCSGNYVQVAGYTKGFYPWPGSVSGAVAHHFQVRTPGRYVIWGRALTEGNAGEAFWVSMDGAPYDLWILDRSAQWKWQSMGDRYGGGDFTYDLSAGRHTLLIQQLDSSPKLDQLLITNDNGFIPNSAQTQGPGPIKVKFEAEAGDISYPMQIGAGDAQCSGDYVQVTDGIENVYGWPGSASGSATYHFQVPKSGNYVIWGRVLASDLMGNSFWISVNNGPYTLWVLDPSAQWMWKPVSATHGKGEMVYQLIAGSHTLMVRYHESSPKLDQLLVTDDPHFF